MAVDITLLFRASVKTVKTRNKALGVAVGGGADGSRDELFRRSPRPKGDFSSRAREVVSCIGEINDFLLEHRREKVTNYSHIMSEYGRMTDTERDQIDQDAQLFMRTCSEAIQQLRAEGTVLWKTPTDDLNTSKLEPEPSAKTREPISSETDSQNPLQDSEEKPVADEYPGSHSPSSSADSTSAPQDNPRGCRFPSFAQMRLLREAESPAPGEKLLPVRPGRLRGSAGPCSPRYTCRLKESLRLSSERLHLHHGSMSPEDARRKASPLGAAGTGQFEQENQRLIGEMSSLFEEVRQIEGKVVEISRLQEIFTEKVLQQEAEIDSIHQLVVGATENIKEGNEDIREAIKNNAGFRVWILFFLVMCSFSLLFLDWYDS
ncbi:syntaxin-18 [Orycteropus afer afer]|uniref:Syntaxin-18 n=1 Tax=Orycteropus afer afer TaxID=1230840 RepID=A0A8B7AHL4_ORYAF|nr:syntaxin-18 [Orycteropus afer afer]